MKTSVIIISNNPDNNESTTIVDYNSYFNDIHVIGIKNYTNDLNKLFHELDSEYIIIAAEDEYYAEDSYMLYSYIQSHEMDFLIGNRANTYQYQELPSWYAALNNSISGKVSKMTKTYIPDLLSMSYVLSKNFYKSLDIAKYKHLQSACITNSNKYASVDIRCIPRTYSKPEVKSLIKQLKRDMKRKGK